MGLWHKVATEIASLPINAVLGSDAAGLLSNRQMRSQPKDCFREAGIGVTSAAGNRGKGCKEEELDSLPRSRAGERPEGSWKWVEGDTGQVSPCRSFAAYRTQAKGGRFAALVPVRR